MIKDGTNSTSLVNCACMTGYKNDETTGDCVDIDECELGIHKCVDNICYNLGMFQDKIFMNSPFLPDHINKIFRGIVPLQNYCRRCMGNRRDRILPNSSKPGNFSQKLSQKNPSHVIGKRKFQKATRIL